MVDIQLVLVRGHSHAHMIQARDLAEKFVFSVAFRTFQSKFTHSKIRSSIFYSKFLDF